MALTAISGGKIVLTGDGVTGTLAVGFTAAKCTDPNADQTSANPQSLSWLNGAAGTLTISSSGKIAITAADALEIQAAANMKVLSGADIILTGNDTNAGKVIWDGTTCDFEVYVDSPGGGLYFHPTVDNTMKMNYGRSNKRFTNIEGYASGYIWYISYIDSNNSASVRIQHDASAFARFSLQDEGVMKTVIFEYENGGIQAVYPGQTNQWDFGTTDYKWKNAWLAGNLSVGGQAGIGVAINAAYQLLVQAPDAQSAINMAIVGKTYSDATDNVGLYGYAAGGGGTNNMGVFGQASGASNNYPFKDMYGNYSDQTQWVNAACIREKKALVRELDTLTLSDIYDSLNEIRAYGYRSKANTIIGYDKEKQIVDVGGKKMPAPIYGNPNEFPEQFGFILDEGVPEFLLKRNKQGEITGYGSGTWVHYLFLCIKYQKSILEHLTERINILEEQ